jgi:hypothetical protein
MALERVELPTHGLGNRCSIHLSYRAKLIADCRFQLEQIELDSKAQLKTKQCCYSVFRKAIRASRSSFESESPKGWPLTARVLTPKPTKAVGT